MKFDIGKLSGLFSSRKFISLVIFLMIMAVNSSSNADLKTLLGLVVTVAYMITTAWEDVSHNQKTSISIEPIVETIRDALGDEGGVWVTDEEDDD